MHRALKTIKVDWLDAVALEMFLAWPMVGVSIPTFAQTGESTREGP